MYKSIFTSAVMVLTFQANAQDFPSNDAGKYEFSEVVSVDGATKEQLFRTSRAWFLDNFDKKAQGDNAIQVDDSYLGEMTATPLLWVDVKSLGKKQSAGAVSFSISVSSKEGKYKYTIGNFYHEANRSTVGSGGALENTSPDCGEESMTLQTWNDIKASTKAKFDVMITEMKAKMAAAASNAEGDW